MEVFDDVVERDFAVYEALNEVLLMVLQYTEEARHASSDLAIGVHLKMASRALRNALEIYGQHLISKDKQ